MSELLCPECGHDFIEHSDVAEANVTFFDFGGKRADVQVACPICDWLIETEMSLITGDFADE